MDIKRRSLISSIKYFVEQVKHSDLPINQFIDHIECLALNAEIEQEEESASEHFKQRQGQFTLPVLEYYDAKMGNRSLITKNYDDTIEISDELADAIIIKLREREASSRSSDIKIYLYPIKIGGIDTVVSLYLTDEDAEKTRKEGKTLIKWR